LSEKDIQALKKSILFSFDLSNEKLRKEIPVNKVNAI